MSNRNQIEQEVITNKFVSEWTPRFPQIPVKYENRNFTPPINAAWASFSIRSGRVGEAAISSIMPRGIGIVYLQMFMPENAGTLIAREMADRFADVFDNWHYVYAATTNYPRGDFWFKRVEVVPVGQRDGWLQWNATVEFKHDEQVISPFATGAGGGDMLKADYAYGGGAGNPNEVDHAMYADAVVWSGVSGTPASYPSNWNTTANKPATFPPDATAELVARKGQTNGYCGLDVQGKIAQANLPATPDPFNLLRSLFAVASITVSGATTLNWANGEVQQLSLTGNASIALTGWPPAGSLAKLVLDIKNTGAFSITGWATSIKWAGGSPPTITSGSGKQDVITLMTFDGGTTVLGSVVGQDYH